MSMNFELVIFDCDGVLVDSELLASQVLSEIIHSFGGSLSAQECRAEFTGSSLKAVKSRLINHYGLTLPDDFIDQIRAKDRVVFERNLRPIKGISEVLEELSTPKCVASSGSLEKITDSLTLTGLMDHLHPHLFSAQMVKHGKPAPDLFLHAGAQMGAKPEKCIVIEDSVVGVKAAKAAGMTTLGFVGGSHCDNQTADALKSAGADDVFDQMPKLPRLIA